MISIVVPVFNSEKTLRELHQRISQVFSEMQMHFELILVDDGSKDKSWEEIEKLQNENKNITGIRFTRNFGQHSALLAGFFYVKGELVLTIDDDLQHPPEEIPKLVKGFEESFADVVYGIPIQKHHSGLRNAGSKTLTFTSQYQDHQGSSFRLIKAEFIHKITTNHQYNHLFLDALLSWYTGNFHMVEVEHHPRKSGKSGYTFGKLMKVYLRMIINYSVVPLRILIYGGLTMSILSFLMGTYFIYKKLIHDVPLGYTSLIVAVLFSTSLIILGLGFIGLYIHKLYEYNLQKPVYFVNKVLPAKNDH